MIKSPLTILSFSSSSSSIIDRKKLQTIHQQREQETMKTLRSKQLHHVLLLVIAFLLLIPSLSTIHLGSTLLASNRNQSWSSPNSIFSLSFVPVELSTSPSTYLASITYAGGVRIWSAGAVDSGGSLRLLPTGSLRLVNGSGATVWDSSTENRGVSLAVLDDYGNLALVNNKSVPVWSSFENPTDVIVTSQNFTLGKTLKSGVYSFSLSESGNLTLNWNGSIEYWSQGLSSFVDTKISNPSLELQSYGILYISASSLANVMTVAYSSDYGESGDVLRFVRLDEDGNLRIYTSRRNQGTLKKGWAAISDQCLVFGYCGDLGICSYNDLGPICECPSQNFEFIDVKNSRKGCRRKVEVENCAIDNTTIVDMANTMFLTYGVEVIPRLYNPPKLACRSNCLVNPACIASTSLSDGSGQCVMKIPSFVSGYKNPAILSTSYVKVCGQPLPNPSPSLHVAERSKYWIVVVVIGTILGLIAVEGGLWWWCCRSRVKVGGLSDALLEYASSAPVQFSYKELQRSTKSFKEKLGEGGFGAVYRGILANKTIVAVKQLEGIEQGEKQFKMEVATISSTHHLNLVRLIGFCSEGRHRLLAYEFMENGSLDSFLFTTFEQKSGKSLTWEMRFNVALGTARGITYLHEECRDCIVHCDIKPENILLDKNYNAKVSDFGLAKLINLKGHPYRKLTSVRGTRGYLAPEWLTNLPITSKSDVYSFGMVLLEIVSGKRNFEVSDETNQLKFSGWAYEELEKGNLWGIVDKRLADQNLDMEQVKRVIQVGFWCIQEQPSQRPMMGKVVQMLEGITDIGNPPPPKPLIEGSASGTSINTSPITSPFPFFVASGPAPSRTSSKNKQVFPLLLQEET